MAINIKDINKEDFEDVITEGIITKKNRGGYVVESGDVSFFMPRSLAAFKDSDDVVGRKIKAQVVKIDPEENSIVVSRRKVLESQRDKLKKETLAKLEEGTIVKGVVTRLTNFGAFIDLGGVDGLLHISEFSWNRIESPNEVLNIGDEVETKVLKIKGNKISLSMKALQENPFDIAIRAINEGDVVNCRVLRNLTFGSFVEIVPGVEGLIPISEMSRGRRISNPSEIVTEGEMVEAQILKIKPNARKISLSLKSLQPDPWDAVCDDLNVGDEINGHIESIASFGAFIKITDGVSGLLPNVKMKPVNLVLTKDNIGEEIQVRIAKVDRATKRISLEPTNMPEQPARRVENRSDWRKYKQEKSQEVMEDNPFAGL